MEWDCSHQSLKPLANGGAQLTVRWHKDSSQYTKHTVGTSVYTIGPKTATKTAINERTVAIVDSDSNVNVTVAALDSYKLKQLKQLALLARDEILQQDGDVMFITPYTSNESHKSLKGNGAPQQIFENDPLEYFAMYMPEWRYLGFELSGS